MQAEAARSKADRASWAILFLIAMGIVCAGAAGFVWWSGRAERDLAHAEALLESGDPLAAMAWLEALQADPASRDRAALLRARIALAQGRAAEAVAPLDTIAPDSPWAAEAAFWRGRTLFQVRQVRRATAWFREALTRRPQDAETLKWLAASLYELGDVPSTVAALTSVTEINPDDARVWRTLGLLNKENGDHEKAWTAYQESLRRDPAQPLVRFEMAEALVAMGRYREAEDELESCRAAVPEADRLALLAHCLQFRGGQAEYRAHLDQALRSFPDHPGLLTYRASLDLKEGAPARAVDRFTRVVALNPYHAQAIYQRGLAYRQLGNLDAAERDLARAAELNGWIAEMDRLNREAGRRPEDPEVRYELGRVSSLLGKHELAASWYVAALACDPTHAQARFGLKALNREDLIRRPSRDLAGLAQRARGDAVP